MLTGSPIAKLVDGCTWCNGTLISWIPGNEHRGSVQRRRGSGGTDEMTRVGVVAENGMDAVFPRSDFRRRRIGWRAMMAAGRGHGGVSVEEAE